LVSARDDQAAILLSVPAPVAKEVLVALAPALAGRVVVDATNDAQVSGKMHALDGLSVGAHPVRAFNILGREVFENPVAGGVQFDLLYAVEEGVAREVAERLHRDVGFQPVWLGRVDTFDVSDSVTRLWLTLACQRQPGGRLAFKVFHET
jgi:predicted dinucleotide-binding enzyme